ncbi:LOW QUALITY PROTEIN: diacylglycerol kinase delta-like [Liolophura sinensis]|uniref:LOW QUALITY PROTEIN: diacylglycerol kinase delta-like n=1 Tax=Liolophura sinensis TaxID=3198878 RepID=UPI0031596051
MKQTSSFQRWRRRYFKLKGRKLYYAKDHSSEIFNEIELTDLSLAECSTKNINHSFQVITPFRNLVLCAESRREMEEWISALKSASNREYYESSSDHKEMMSGQHNWYACSHARPTYCNVCREALSGVTSHGLSCEVCKFKAHKRCAVRANYNCKWTTLASIGKDIIENEDGIAMPHQWIEGNLPVSAKCVVCDKTCGSVLRLQDWRCLWCRALVHSSCREQYPKVCPLGQCRISVLPPTAINSTDSDGYWEASRPPGTSPLLVFVNTKSGDNQGVKFLRRFKQLLNPAQIFDLMNGGPHAGLRLFQKFDPFRILVCGGDGSIGWVLSEIDKLDLHKQCQVGVLPFGTGNDLARVLGWGGAIDDDTQLPAILEKLEHSQIKMLDRWSIWTYEGTMPPPRKLSQQFDPISVYEDSVAAHLSKILHSDDHATVISSAKVLCETVKNFVAKVGEDQEKDGDESEESITQKCVVLNEKLKNLLSTLNQEAKASTQEEIQPVEEVIVGSPERDTVPGEITGPTRKTRIGTFKSKNALMCRANSLKKAVRQIIEHTEKAVDEQNAQTEQHRLELEERLHGLDVGDNRIMGLQASSHTSRSAPTFVGMEDTPRIPTVTFREPEGSLSPKGPTSRRISSMSTFNKSASVGSNLSSRGRDKSPSSMPAPAPPEQPTVTTLPFLGLGVQGLTAFPSLSSSIAGRLAGGSFISKVLLANADALCAAASPLIQEDIPLSEYEEKCVMNNYFGIGLDAKITLDFNNKREEHPEKCRSRTKNFMWYGVIGGKEMLQKTFKNLDQRVQLECDGQRIPLPSLQGIVILNIPSYAGGSNFWGGRKEHDNFTAPSFDDKVLEIVAVFGGVQMAMSRVLEFQHHRIAQCRTLKITIMGDEGVPVQVDGEAWIQPPGYIRIEHKNRAQMLTRDRSFENVLKSWSEKQKMDRPITIQSQSLNEEEAAILQNFIEVATLLIKSVKVAALSHSTVEQELFPLATLASDCLDRLYPSGRLLEPTPRSQVIEFILSVKSLYNDTGVFLADKATVLPINPEVQDKLNSALAQTEVELRKVMDIAGVLQAQQFSQYPAHTDEVAFVEHKHHKKGKLKQVFGKIKGRSKEKDRDSGNIPQVYNVHHWTSEEVGLWLESLGLSEYKNSFESHDIRGSELLALERRDLKDLGISKVGHLKRIQHGIKDLITRSAAYERATSGST